MAVEPVRRDGGTTMLNAAVTAQRAERWQRVVRYVRANLSQRIRVEDLAAVAELSPAHFAREFKREGGMTPHAFVMRCRVLHARTLLGEGETVATAAMRAGFSDQSHLCRCFKAVLGAQPSRYRQSPPRNSRRVQVARPAV